MASQHSLFDNITDLNRKTFGITKVGRESHISTILMASRQGCIDDMDFNIMSLDDLNSMI